MRPIFLVHPVHCILTVFTLDLRFVEEEIGQGRNHFKCLEESCSARYATYTLQRVVGPEVYTKILERRQVEEVSAAGIEDLESCPFCDFKIIMPNKNDKVFLCFNPDCGKDSCRWVEIALASLKFLLSFILLITRHYRFGHAGNSPRTQLLCKQADLLRTSFYSGAAALTPENFSQGPDSNP